MRGARGGIDLLVLVAAWLIPWALRFEFDLDPAAKRQIVVLLPYVVFAQFAALSFLGVERQSWRYISLRETIHITRAIAVVSLVLLSARIVAPGLQSFSPRAAYLATPLSIILMNGAIAVGGLLAVRVARRLQSQYVELRHVERPTRITRVLLVGAGRAGVMVARELDARPELGIRPVGFVDDDLRKQRAEVHGIPVIGTTADIAALTESHRVDEAIITMANVDSATIRRITELCKDAGLPTKIIPGIYEIVGGRVNLNRIRPVAIEDLLGRDPVQLDSSGIRDLVAHDVVLVTGAGGSIGSELCRQLARFDPRTIVLVEQAENALWAIHRELEDAFDTVRFVPAIADVCDRDRIDHLLLEHRPSIVFHAAAHKHVPMMEWNPGEAIKNNVLGTRTVADLALARGVERFVMISTDKAVNPTSIMGATKRIAERYVQHLAHTSGKPFVSVRFGNVLGSAGSVVPIFKEQIAAGGPITVTHPEMTRYFMTIPEASQLVIQAATLATSGEIFVLDMGEPVRIVDLARDLIELSGFQPDVDIAIEFTGTRPGEKMYEELSLSHENAERTMHPKIWTGRNPEPDWSTAEHDLDQLTTTLETLTREDAQAAVSALVPEFAPLPRTPREDDTATFLADAGPA